MYDLLAIALQTDQTRFITFEISELGANHGIEGVNRGYHTLSHHGREEENLNGLTKVELVHTENLAYFFDKLKAVQEPNGKSLFENTLTLIGAGMSNASSHSNSNLQTFLTGGGFKHVGEHIVKKKNKSADSTLCDLYATILNRFGVQVEKFNTGTGTFDGLTAV